MRVLGISCYYHDAAACLMIDGQVVAAGAEERFTRIKHDNHFPQRAIEYCLQQAGLSMHELDGVAFYEKPVVKFERVLHQHLQHFPKSLKSFLNTGGEWIHDRLQIKEKLQQDLNYHGPVFYVPHHQAHAASAFYFSGFKKAAIVTIDGVGEWATTTIGLGAGEKIRQDKEIRFPHSLGLLYSTFTTYLGFSANDAEYKVMGLAAYGDPKPLLHYFDDVIQTFPDGSYQLNLSYFDFEHSDHMPSSKLVALFGQPARQPESEMTPFYENLAASLQLKLEQVVFNLLTATYQKYKTPYLCLAGGVALNSVLNGKILSHTPFKKLYIPPDPSDAGGAIGAAAIVSRKLGQSISAKFQPYLGPGFDWHHLVTALKAHDLPFQHHDKLSLTKFIAKELQAQKVIGWFQGRMEWGPRALGNRSILASAATTEMRDVINLKVKHRELFRPFAPVILEEYTDKYFVADKNLSISARYMLMVYPFKAIGKREVPAVVHVDGSGRLQTLARVDNELYYDVIKAYQKLTGVPIIINTSFNVRGEPIVCTPTDAIRCFLHTDIDYLVLGNYVVAKADLVKTKKRKTTK
jgi:carbamoyltransferase